MKTYTVMREHIGDRAYVVGDKREANPHEVAHLVANGVLIEKAEVKLSNKAEKPASNKADK